MNIKQKVWLKLQQLSIYIYIFSNQSFESIDYLYYPANISLDGDALKTSWIHCSSSSSEDVFKTFWWIWIYSPWSYVFRRRLQDVLIKTNILLLANPQAVFKMFSRRLQDFLQNRLRDIFKRSSRRFEDFFETSSRHLQDVLQRYIQDVFKMYHQVKLTLLTRSREVFSTFLRRTVKKVI